MKAFKHTKLMAAIVLASQSYHAHSLIYTLDVTTESTAAFLSGPIDTDSDTSTTFASSYAGTSNINGDGFTNTGANGSSNGSFYMTSDTSNFAPGLSDTFYAYSTLTQSYEVTNDSALDQLFDFTFQIENGSISTRCGEDYYGEEFFGFDGPIIEEGYGGFTSVVCDADDRVGAAYEAEIFLNGDSIWNSSASIIQDENGAVIDLSNDVLDGYQFDNYYGWGAKVFTLDLGSFAAGETFTFDYVVSVGTGAELLNGSYVGAYAQFGDPNSFGSSNGVFSTSAVSIPEPTSLALMMAGVMGLGVAAKRKKRKNK